MKVAPYTSQEEAIKDLQKVFLKDYWVSLSKSELELIYANLKGMLTQFSR